MVITALDYVGGVPFDILKPVLAKATASQLYNIEDCNPVCVHYNTYFMQHLFYFYSFNFLLEIEISKSEVILVK